MKKITGLFILLALMSGAKAQQESVAYYPMSALGGDTLHFSYHPRWPAQEVKLLWYMFDTTCRWHACESPMSWSGDTAWTTSFTAPADAGFIAYQFKYNDSLDNNRDTGYFTIFMSNHARYAGGAEAGYGLARSPRYEAGIPGYFDHFTISDTATYMWLSNEILRHRSSAEPLALLYVKAAYGYDTSRAPRLATQALTYLLKFDEEPPLLKAWLIARDYLKDQKLTDSLYEAITKQYPSGALVRWTAWQKAIKDAAPEDRYAQAKNFLDHYPYREDQYTVNRLLGIDYPMIYRNLVAVALSKNDRSVIERYGAQMPFETVMDAYYKGVELPYDVWKNMDVKAIFPYSDTLYQRMLYMMQHRPAAYWYYPTGEWQAYCRKAFSNYFQLHARMLMELGHTGEALVLARATQQYYNYRLADLNQTEALLLKTAGQMAALDTVLLASVQHNQVTPALKELLHEMYIRRGGHGDFDTWLGSLKDEEATALLQKHISEQQLSEQAPAFTLLDGKGHKVKLEDMKGKVVVLDFWATWCAPCKAAMAGMNMAVEKYREDKKVAFFFIDTQEHIGDYKTKAQAFLKEKNYPFTILFDEGEKMDKTYTAYRTLLHTSGIPFKAVIDAKGVLRFANIGYKGSPSELADEISMMIELAKKP